MSGAADNLDPAHLRSLIRDALGDEEEFELIDGRADLSLCDPELVASLLATCVSLAQERREFPRALEGIPLFRIGFFRRITLRLFNKLFADQRRFNLTVVDAVRAQQECIAAMAERLIELERAARAHQPATRPSKTDGAR